MTYCHVSRQIDSHMTDMDDAESRADAIEAIVSELMAPGGEYDPLDPENMCEAIGDGSDSFWVVMTALLAENDGEKLVALQRSLSETYWQARAEEAVIKHLDALQH